jgi:hypothetical protein
MIRTVKQFVWKEISPYKHRAGLRKTVWFLFIPLFSTTDWTIDQ